MEFNYSDLMAQLGENSAAKKAKVEKHQAQQTFHDNEAEVPVVTHRKTAMQVPSGSSGFPLGSVASGTLPKTPR